MQSDHSNPNDAKLGALLRASRVAPPLPPRFQESVWRRIENGPAGASAESSTWLEVVVAWALRPRLAYAAVAALMLAGALLGVRDGTRLARQDAQAHYLAAVAPNPVR
jgi:hypothetical protein